MARRVIDGNHYMTLATLDPDGRPRLPPVYYTCVRHAAFYWVSSAGAQHSRNLAERPAVEIVIFDTTARVGEGEAVYIAAKATVVADRELDEVAAEAFQTTAGARQLTPRDLRRADLCLYVARMRSCEVHGEVLRVLQQRPARVFEVLGGVLLSGRAQLVAVLAADLVQRLGRQRDDVVVIDADLGPGS
jgi:uncharacterized pyridoxamine 5'-phosphate oxidase family protein